MEIVQISDIHVGGSQFREDTFDMMVQEVNELRPSAVVVTGDLTNEGLIKEYEKCRQKLNHLETDRLITISGNHDYRNTGYLVFRNYFPFNTVNEIGDDAVIVTLGTARPDRDEGEVGYRQNLWAERTLKTYGDRIKILAMHHHLIAVPDSGTNQVLAMDAGDVLRTALMSNVNLVLCGHKHRPWIWNLGKLSVVNAGTVSSERMRGLFENTYNIVKVENNKISVDLKIVGGKRAPLEDLVKDYSGHGRQEVQ